MLTVTSQHLQAQFGEICNVIKSHEPVIVTQSGKPTMMILSYDEGIEALRQYRAKQFVAWLDERAKNCPDPEPSEEEMAQLSRIIEEEREAVYQENLKKNAK